jgi:hypothetical protein
MFKKESGARSGAEINRKVGARYGSGKKRIISIIQRRGFKFTLRTYNFKNKKL